MRGDEHECRRSSTMRQRNLGRSGRAKSRGDSGNNFKGDGIGAKRFDLFTSASKNERIAAL